MSSPAFSHQFSQRWIATPAPIKGVILQELEDIATLLHPDTDLATFNFSTPHLHEKIDSMMQAEHERIRAEALEKEAREQAEKAQAEREQAEHERAEQEKQRQLAVEKAERDKAIQENQHLKQVVMTDLIKQMEDYIQLSLQETAEKLRAELRPWLEAEVEKQLQERVIHKTN